MVNRIKNLFRLARRLRRSWRKLAVLRHRALGVVVAEVAIVGIGIDRSLIKNHSMKVLAQDFKRALGEFPWRALSSDNQQDTFDLWQQIGNIGSGEHGRCIQHNPVKTAARPSKKFTEAAAIDDLRRVPW